MMKDRSYSTNYNTMNVYYYLHVQDRNGIGAKAFLELAAENHNYAFALGVGRQIYNDFDVSYDRVIVLKQVHIRCTIYCLCNAIYASNNRIRPPAVSTGISPSSHRTAIAENRNNGVFPAT